MVPLTIRKLGLTLVLLLSCFASAPFGSMEQAPEGVPEQLASSRSLPAVQSAVGVRLDDLYPEPDQRPPSGAHEFFLPLPAAPIAGAVSGSHVSGDVLRPTARALPPRICERLPYDATAPPPLV